MTIADISEWAGISYTHLVRIRQGASFGLGVASKVQNRTGKSLDEIMAMTGRELFAALETAYMKHVVSEREK